jgi:hypothetical protein
LEGRRTPGSQARKEVPLPHSPRVIVFLDQDTACLAYSSNEYALFNLTTMAASEITLPPAPVTVSSTARGAFTGLSGYMSLGFRAKTKPCAVAMSGLEVLIVKDSRWLLCVVRRNSSSTKTRASLLVKTANPPELRR